MTEKQLTPNSPLAEVNQPDGKRPTPGTDNKDEIPCKKRKPYRKAATAKRPRQTEGVTDREASKPPPGLHAEVTVPSESPTGDADPWVEALVTSYHALQEHCKEEEGTVHSDSKQENFELLADQILAATTTQRTVLLRKVLPHKDNQWQVDLYRLVQFLVTGEEVMPPQSDNEEEGPDPDMTCEFRFIGNSLVATQLGLKPSVYGYPSKRVVDNRKKKLSP